MRLLLLTAAIVLAAACGRFRSDTEFYEGVPTLEGLTLEVTGDPSEETGFLRPEGGVSLTTSAVTVGEVPEQLRQTREGARAVNLAVRHAFETVKTLLEEDGRAGAPGTRIYGPVDQGEVTYQLTVRRFTRTSFGFKLQAKPAGAEDSGYLVVMGGAMNRGTEAHRGRGVVGINLNHQKEIDPSFPGSGLLLAAFAHRPEGKALAFRALEFSPDTTEYAPVTAAFVGHRRSENGATAVRLATKADLENVENNTAEKELVRLRARWIPQVGGRAAAIAFGGDIPEGTSYVAVACWNASTEQTFKVVSKCVLNDAGERTCTPVHQAGTRETCAVALGDVEAPAGDALDTTQEEGTPDDSLIPPESEPSGDSEV